MESGFTASDIDVQINLSYAATSVATASAMFANNVGAGVVTVFDGLLSLSSSGFGSPNPFDIVIDVANSFSYDPRPLGDLLVDIFMRSSPYTAFFDATNWYQSGNATTRIFSFPGDVNAATGIVGYYDGDSSPYGLVTRFDFVAPGDWYSVTLGAGETVLRVETSTPGDGPGQFVNVLNPRSNCTTRRHHADRQRCGAARRPQRNAAGDRTDPRCHIQDQGRLRDRHDRRVFPGRDPLATPPITVKKDDGDWGYQVTGSGWVMQTTGGYQNDYRLHAVTAAASATNVARWIMTPSGSTCEVFVSWLARPTNATNATYKVYDGNTLRGTVVVDQTRSPNDVLLSGGVVGATPVLAESLGSFSFATSLATGGAADVGGQRRPGGGRSVRPAGRAGVGVRGVGGRRGVGGAAVVGGRLRLLIDEAPAFASGDAMASRRARRSRAAFGPGCGAGHVVLRRWLCRT